MHIITDCCSVEGNGLFCLGTLGKARMNRLKLKKIRGCFLGLFKGKDSEMLARIGKTEICQALKPLRIGCRNTCQEYHVQLVMPQDTEKESFPSSRFGHELWGSSSHLCNFHVLGKGGEEEHEETG